MKSCNPKRGQGLLCISSVYEVQGKKALELLDYMVVVRYIFLLSYNVGCLQCDILTIKFLQQYVIRTKLVHISYFS
jgi:hypothetical protein